ncbi:hypothetical protein AVEN_54292-1 [Araneus ventricosus]|uniref:Retrovirus-related Pol polyprotein from transposon TNT 1-94-like beta-barrel domain-containing protein n=1 Tax=Araneus ventricosus TaxID=182803 RepID=A0A4Y2TS04_ARAVE|nr:hypothetical protein AVEN_54292-1 [Araneus ventricosus]
MNTFEDMNFSFPKLNATNYTTWKVGMELFLLDRGSLEFLEGDPKPYHDDSSEQEKRAYEFRKLRAYTSIYQSVERTVPLPCRKVQPLSWKPLCDNPLPLLTTRFPKPFRQAFFAIWDVLRNCRQKVPSSNNCRRIEGKCQQEKSRPSISRKAFYSELSRKPPVNPEEIQITSTSPKIREWLIDSAATSRFCKNIDCFSNFRHVTETKVFVGDKNCSSQVHGTGNIVINVKDGNRNIQIELINVYYAPNMRPILISGANLDIAEFKVIWKNNK